MEVSCQSRLDSNLDFEAKITKYQKCYHFSLMNFWTKYAVLAQYACKSQCCYETFWAKFHPIKCCWITLNSEKFSLISHFKGLNSDSKQMRWAPTCNNREASGMAYGEYEDDFWSDERAFSTFFKSRPGGGPQPEGGSGSLTRTGEAFPSHFFVIHLFSDRGQKTSTPSFQTTTQTLAQTNQKILRIVI